MIGAIIIILYVIDNDRVITDRDTAVELADVPQDAHSSARAYRAIDERSVSSVPQNHFPRHFNKYAYSVKVRDESAEFFRPSIIDKNWLSSVFEYNMYITGGVIEAVRHRCRNCFH